MGGKVNYIIVGLFVVLLSALLIIAALWLSDRLSRRAVYLSYSTYLSESVSGLNFNSPVKFNGVTAGFVRHIELDTKNPQHIKVTLAIKQGTPITKSTTALLASQGLTGIAYIELDPHGNDNTLLLPTSDDPAPVIPSKTSFINEMEKKVSLLADNLDHISTSVRAVLDQENQQNLKQGLIQLNKTLHYIHEIAHNTEIASRQFPQTLSSIQRSADAFSTMTVNIDKTSTQVAKTMQDGELAIETLSTQVMPVAVDLLERMQTLMTNLGLFSAELRQNPTILLRGRKPSKLGPGEQLAKRRH